MEKVLSTDQQIPLARLTVMHLLPGACAFLLMLLAGYLFPHIGIFPTLPVIFLIVGPFISLSLLGFLYYQGKQFNGRLSLQGVVLYRQKPLSWWKMIALTLPICAWIAIVWYAFKPSINEFFIRTGFSWMLAYLFDEHFLNNLGQYPPAILRLIGILFLLSICLGAVVEELYFRGYLLPRMEHLGGWVPVLNVILFSLYHFWSPWENVVRLLGLTPWVVSVWRHRSLYLSILIHLIINAFSGLSLLSLILKLT